MRYRAIANISLEFEGDSSHTAALTSFKDKIDELLKDVGDSYSSQVTLLNVPTKRRPKRIGEFTVEEVLPYITEYESYKTYISNGQEYKVRMNIDKYFVFLEHIHCAACNLEGTKMILELSPENIPHFNLYGVDKGKLILMTRDHTTARANGGKSHISNYKTYCSVCNNLKADYHLTPKSVYQIRQLYDKHHGKMPQKELKEMLNRERERLEKLDIQSQS